jgi:lipopolysaccharide transport system ATP-binding protein
MTDIAIRVESLSKRYRLGQREPYKTLRDALTRAVKAPYRRLRSSFQGTNGRQAAREYIWALKDVSFEVKGGEVVGIIGRNGAGKSTLLKILSRITEPTAGCAEILGRVGSLLEVGTGFNPELTGRENIYLNGAILGMKRAEIDRKFDEIVAFSGVEKFIDTPVKRYSSGMTVRLAFAVAAHLEPEILLVDEVLAVGDAEFQRKCLSKMQDVTQQGRTILFVSHNMAAIRNLCVRTLLIDKGQIVMDSDTEAAISQYLDRNLVRGAVVSEEELAEKGQVHLFHGKLYFQCKEIALHDRNGNPRNEFDSDEEIIVSVTYECLQDVPTFRLVIDIVNGEGVDLLRTENLDDPASDQYVHLKPGLYRSQCVLPKNLFGENSFFLTVWLIYQNVQHLTLEKIMRFETRFKGYNRNFSIYSKGSAIRPRLSWSTTQI